MQTPKNVSKYLGGHLKDTLDTLDNTLTPGALAPSPDQRVQPDFEDESMRVVSLTPLKVLEKIRRDVVTVLGFNGSIAGKFTPLEQRLVDFMERIVRKGHCPSILVKERDLIEAMLCLKKYFETDSVVISPQDQTPQSTINVPIFPALYKYAKDAAFCDQRIREIRQQKSRMASLQEKHEADVEMRQIRERKDNCLIYYQKIIFTDAAAQEKNQKRRSIFLYGKVVSLDELLNFLKKGGRLEQARDSTGIQPPAFEPLQASAPQDLMDDSLGSFDRTDTIDEVVDWHAIKSNPDSDKDDKPGDDDAPHYSFNL